jgi:aspartate-semialdehyde dehydrogenase
MKTYRVCIVGATGLVGRAIIEVLHDRNFPYEEIRCIASPSSAGRTLEARGKSFLLEAPSAGVFEECDIAFFAVREPISREWAPVAAKTCGIVIDNSSAFRMHPNVPLVVPEVNPLQIFGDSRIIANPNCSTIQLVVALKPLYDAYGIRRVVVSTYQSVSGAGQRGLRQLEMERRGEPGELPAFPHRVLNSPLPHIARFESDGYTREERKMVEETRKIMGDQSIQVAPTCVRVPVPNCHSESVNIEFDLPFDLAEARALLEAADGIVVQDNPEEAVYPLASQADGRDEVFVGRLRRDTTVPSGLMMWIVADNLRKGAATNAVQIAEVWASN